MPLVRSMPLILLLVTACTSPAQPGGPSGGEGTPPPAGAQPSPGGDQPVPRLSISFAGDIAPLVEARCATCHHTGHTSGGVRLATADRRADYAAIKAVLPRMVSMIEQGRMPPGGPRVADADLARLEAWQGQGGPDN